MGEQCVQQVSKCVQSMYNWQIELSLEECIADLPQPTASYYLLMRMEHKFSSPTPQLTPTHPHSLSIHNTLTLHYSHPQPTLPKLQVLLVLAPSPSRPQQQIIAISSLTPHHPTTPQTQTIQRHYFEKGLLSKAYFTGRLRVKAEGEEGWKGVEVALGRTEEKKEREREGERREEEEETEFYSPRSISKDVDFESISKQRDQLYRMSEQLYHELKKCMTERDRYLLERDQYMVELRERILSQQQTKQELQFLKLKLDQHDAGLTHGQLPLSQLQTQLQQANDDIERLQTQLERKGKEMLQLERKVREALKAMEEFKKEALQARSQLLRKESQYSLATKHSGYLQPQECMEEIGRELERRRQLQQQLVLPAVVRQGMRDVGALGDQVMAQVNKFTARVLSTVKGVQCQLMRREKLQLQRRLTSRLQPFLSGQSC